ncbi:olfactory receptor 4F6-like [Trachypithecus francoisi]|uniref:olfactory receptor 4F6-like n=1 Tax=Trachypithecus francoisi TaxID=54180 RepID=UPI00141AD50C|nr:olfactory receptor 4F6-like [Trachypithecus francoisi]
MDGANLSVVSEFVFLGLSNSWVIQLHLFLFSSAFYMASLVRNLLIVFSVTSDSNLHSPMYFLLANLSFLDLGVCSIAAPKIIYALFRKRKAISFGGCLSHRAQPTQIFFIHAVGGTEMVLLIAMAFDQYVAICTHLHYLTIMNPRICVLILAAVWILGLIHSVAKLAFVIDLPFCGPNVLDSFYCDLPQLIKLACTETNRLEFMGTANSGLISVGSFSILIISYIFILVTAQKHSSGGLSKAVSTLSALVSVVVLVFGPLIFFYIWPFPSSHLDKFLAIFDAILTPFLNPVIYTLRNKEMKAAMKKLCHQLVSYRKMS